MSVETAEDDLLTSAEHGLEVKFEPSDDGGTCILRLRGDVDVYSAPVLRGTIQHQLDIGCKYVVLDARRSDYFDSTGLGALIGSLKSAKECGATLEFIEHSAQLARILKVTGLIKSFPLMTPERRRRLDC